MEEKMPTGGSRSSEGEREEKCTGSEKVRWAASWIQGLGRKASPRPFLIFISFLLFLFLFPLFLL
jgi:hypothetical protein